MYQFGEKVDGYEVRVLNEREARAAAGLLFFFGMLSFMNSFMLGHFIFTQYFVSFFMFDFFVRLINPNYSPSLLAGRFFVQNQTPEYVGAAQKRFAWSLGFMLSLIMFYLVVIEPQMSLWKIVICVVCLMLLFSESAFSICLGCKMYNFIKKEKAQYCPGDICEIREKEPVVRFSSIQKSILILLSIGVALGLYLFSVNEPSYSSAVQMISMMLGYE